MAGPITPPGPMSSGAGPSGDDLAHLLDGQVHQLSPRIRLAWIVSSALVGLIPAGVLFAVLATSKDANANSNAIAGFCVVYIPWLVLTVLLASWGWAVWKWTPWEDAIELTHGPIVRRSSLVPYHRIQQIDVHRGPLERMLGLSTLILRTAAATTDAKLAGIDADHTEQLRHALLARAGIDDAV